jgi:hypothetical protein
MLEREELTGYDIKDIMEETGLSYSGVDMYLRRGDIQPLFKDGRTKYYSKRVLLSLKDHKPRTFKTPMAPKTSGEYETRITQIEKEIKGLKLSMLKIAQELSRSRKAPDVHVFSET